jgi:hypothetical protein
MTVRLSQSRDQLIRILHSKKAKVLEPALRLRCTHHQLFEER